ncbi:hypothetical protein KKC13_08650 [bacterium]|nr:hypothetical protein [bacterium]MBU1958820.1 hypothetical protein [bacterium]
MQIENEEVVKKPFDVNKVKAHIEKLLLQYRNRKDDLEWADDEWSADEIQVELDGYAREIRDLKEKVRIYEHEQQV